MLARRCLLLPALLLVLPVSAADPGSSQGDAPARSELPAAFPLDRYTPHGYLDNPHHSLVFNRSGVIRSYPPLGFGWWRTDFHKGAYALGDRDHVNSISLLRMGAEVEGRTFFAEPDFDTWVATAAGPTDSARDPELASLYHTKSVVSYDWTAGGVRFHLRFFLAAEHALVCQAVIENLGAVPRKTGLYAVHQYLIGSTRWWGSDGLTARADTGTGICISKVWAYGDVFALGSSAAPDRSCAAVAEEELIAWIRDPQRTLPREATVQGRGPIFSALRFPVLLAPGERRSMLVCLSRGPNERQARRTLVDALSTARDTLQVRLAADDLFWRACPLLEGDWPGSWKRGWVYDFETLRMTVRPPLGIFRHPWDGMQVHAPRLVLGETAMDMLTLSYADPALAREVLEGTFADALAPNIPCAREDGSVNMISADGSECGTAPMWGYPFKAIRAIGAMTGDTSWLRRLYPHLKEYVLWWLEERTDAEGWLHCNNSWESGQDGSRRFLVAENNEGAVADFVRTVDVEASMAEALRMLAQDADRLGIPSDARRWRELADRRVANTRAMFYGDRYHDVDGRTGQPIRLADSYDIMMLAPLTCGVAPPPHVAAVRPTLRRFAVDPPPSLQWPPAVYTYAEAAWFADEPRSAANLVAAIAERVFRRTDARTITPGDGPYGYRVPGVANEYWPVRDVPPGGENYGWGATLPMFLIRAIAGFRETEDGAAGAFVLAPCLPDQLKMIRGRYTVSKLRFRDITFSVTMEADGSGGVRSRMSYSAPRPAALTLRDGATGRSVAQTPPRTEGSVDLGSANGRAVTVQVRIP